MYFEFKNGKLVVNKGCSGCSNCVVHNYSVGRIKKPVYGTASKQETEKIVSRVMTDGCLGTFVELVQSKKLNKFYSSSFRGYINGTFPCGDDTEQFYDILNNLESSCKSNIDME